MSGEHDPRTPPALAPRLARLLAELDAPPTRLSIPPEIWSVRGIEAVETLEFLSVTPSVALEPVALLPRLKSLAIEGRQRRVRRIRLGPLATAPALESLILYNLTAKVEDVAALAAIPTLRVLEVNSAPCPDLRPLATSALRRLELDSASEVRPSVLTGLRVEQLDLWGCGFADIEVLATMPRLREVWLQGNEVPTLRPLLHLTAGARVFLDDSVDPDRHRQDIAALEARGVWLMFASDPSDHGVHPSWWDGGAPPLAAQEQRCPIRYMTPGDAP